MTIFDCKNIRVCCVYRGGHIREKKLSTLHCLKNLWEFEVENFDRWLLKTVKLYLRPLWTARQHVQRISGITAITNKANCVLAQLRRSTVSRSCEMVTSLYKTYVRPIVESSVQVWNPWLRRDIDHIEKIQRRATKLVSGIGSKPYDERLKICKLTTLEERRLRGDLLECNKIINNFTNVEKCDFFSFTRDRHQIHTRGVAEDLLVPQVTRLDIRKHFFSNRVVNYWNNLPLEIRSVPGVNSFKNEYDDYNASYN